MINVVINKDNSYTIYKNYIKVFESLNQISPFNDVIKIMDLDSGESIMINEYTGDDVEVSMIKEKIDYNKFIQETQSSNDDLFDSVTETLNYNNVTHKNYNKFIQETQSSNDDLFDSVTETLNYNNVTHKNYNKFLSAIVNTEIVEDVVKSSSKNVPVGNIEIPEIGDLVYVDGMKGNLCTLLAGVATVSGVKIIPTKDEDGDYEEVFIEIEEVLGAYFSWTLLKEKQEDLQAVYGYKPAQRL